MSDQAKLQTRTCSCDGQPALAAQHVLTGLLRTALAFIIPGLVFAVIWGVIDWMRSYGLIPTVPLYLPFTAQNIVISGDHQMNQFEKFVDTYNVVFPGACRFGSGIGMAIGGFWSLAKVRKNCNAEKLVVGIIAGGLLCARILLMLSSQPQPVLLAFFYGAVLIPLYLLNSNKLYAAADLPRADIDPRYQGG